MFPTIHKVNILVLIKKNKLKMNRLNNTLKSLKVIIFLAKSHEEYIICEEAPKIQIVGKL